MTAPVRRQPPVSPLAMWLSLVSLCLGTAVLGAVFTLMMWRSQVANDERDADLRRDLCALTSGLAGGPTPAPGPAGDRARALAPLMDRLRETSCQKREG